MSKYVRMQEVDNPGMRTKRWTVFSCVSNQALGAIFFHAPWRKYVWQMNQGVIFDVSCTQEIVAFLEEHKNDRQGV